MVHSILSLIICVWGTSQPQGHVTINFYSYLKILNFLLVFKFIFILLVLLPVCMSV